MPKIKFLGKVRKQGKSRYFLIPQEIWQVYNLQVGKYYEIEVDTEPKKVNGEVLENAD